MEKPEERVGVPAARGFSLRPRQRLRATADFQRVYDARAVLHGSRVVVFARPNGLPFSRLGVSVGRKHGGAVRRNRIKRVLREAFRLAQGTLPAGYDFVLVPRTGSADMRTAEMLAELLKLAPRVERVWENALKRGGAPKGGA